MTPFRYCLAVLACLTIAGAARAESPVPTNFVDDFGVTATARPDGGGAAQNPSAMHGSLGEVNPGYEAGRDASGDTPATSPREHRAAQEAQPQHVLAPGEDPPHG